MVGGGREVGEVGVAGEAEGVTGMAQGVVPGVVPVVAELEELEELVVDLTEVQSRCGSLHEQHPQCSAALPQ